MNRRMNMREITLDYSNIMDLLDESDITGAINDFNSARDRLIKGTGQGSDFLGWVDLPEFTGKSFIDDIKKTSESIRNNSEAFVVIGIGGSYLGARAAIEALLPNNYNQRVKPEIYFLGTSLSPRQIKDTMELLEGKKITVNVISKSGTTTEPALAFRIVRDWMVKNYGKSEALKRIIVTTDASKGALKKFADEEKLKTYTIPDNIGGRFSVLTPVGILPIAVSGIDLDELFHGAREGVEEYRNITDINQNPSSMYAVLRHLLYTKGKVVEILANFEPQFHYIAEWWKQLFGESEGKENKGIFPASVDFTSDLHSMGQWIQQGRRDIFETFINIEEPEAEINIPNDPDNLDKLNFLTGKSFSYVNKQALLGTRAAHLEGGVPNMTINIPRFNPHCIGKLFYFFEWAVGISGYMLGVNPFDQPGVESYKKNMFALLDKPGFEEESKKIIESIKLQKKYEAGLKKALKAK
jgi:glucose-6-phosphate isomerase